MEPFGTVDQCWGIVSNLDVPFEWQSFIEPLHRAQHFLAVAAVLPDVNGGRFCEQGDLPFGYRLEVFDELPAVGVFVAAPVEEAGFAAICLLDIDERVVGSQGSPDMQARSVEATMLTGFDVTSCALSSGRDGCDSSTLSPHRDASVATIV